MYMYLNSIILIITCSVLYLYWYARKQYCFFEQHGIPYIKPTFVFGNMIEVILLRKSMAEAYADLYKRFEPHRFAGIYAGTKPMVLIRDPQLLKDILIKDFAHFTDRGWDVDPVREPLTNFLFFMNGDDWKNLRIKLTGAFTTGKMKMMFPLVKACGEKFQNVIDRTQSIDAKELCARYMTDVISSCAFGLEANSLDDPKAEFRVMGKKALQFRFRTLLRMLQLNIPKVIEKLFNITLLDPVTQKFFSDIIINTVSYREKNNVVRNDLLDLLIAIKNNKLSTRFRHTIDSKDHEDLDKFLDQVGGDKEGNNEMEITNKLLAAQAILFFVAGFETSSTALTYILLELSQNKPIQDKVRKEIQDVLKANNGQLSYDVLKQMTYTDMVMQETLRKYLTVSMVTRRTNIDYKVRDSDVVIPAGTTILISIYGLHMDEKYYPDPRKFCPERFTEEQKSNRVNFTYLPFGDGPRHCIGMRLAKMTVKIGMINALRNFSYQVSPKMKFPLIFDKNFGLLTPYNEILLQREKLN